MCKIPDGRDWLWGKLDLVLVGKGMLSKSLIQFSADGWGRVPSPEFGLRPNRGGDNGCNVDLLQKKDLGQHAGPPRTVAVSVPEPATGHCQPMPPPETPRHTQASLVSHLWGHSSFLLGPGVRVILFVPSKSLFPQACGSSVIKSADLQSQIPWGFLVPLPDPQVGKSLMGPRISSAV